MKNEKNFYDILNSKFNEREIPFDEDNWTAMRGIIDDSRASKKHVLWLVATLFLLLCAGAELLIPKWNSGEGKHANGYTNASIRVSSENKGVGNDTHSNPKLSANHAGDPLLSTTNKMAIPSNNANRLNTSSASGNTTNNTAMNGIVSAQNAKDASPYKKNSNSKHRVKSSNKIGASASETAMQTSPTVSFNQKGSADNYKPNDITKNAKQNNLLSDKKEPVSPVPSTSKTTQAASLLLAKAKSSTSAKSPLHGTDSATAGSEPLPERFSNEPRVFLGKTNFVSVEIGAEYSGGWQIGSVVQAKGFNFVVGAGYTHYLGSKWFIKTGLQFSTFGNMSPLTYNYQHSVGHVIYDSVITTQRLYFLRLPVQVEYFVGRSKKSSVGIGGAVWYLVGSSGYATTYQQTDNNPPADVQKYTQNTVLDGYSRVNISAYGFYRYVFSRKFSMYIMLYSELTNMKDNTFFGENIIEKTHGFQYMLSYNLN
jgi:hypothetical protein